jgi:protein involved in polysaccharide export with SLBB domain
MYRFIALILALLVTFAPASTAFAQAGRYRVPTQAEQGDLGPAPSFRGGERQGETQYEQMMPGMPQMRSGQLEAGEAAMMGAGYSVHVLGEVQNPGTYLLPASTRVAQAIQRAGGIAENGSERNIEIRRKGGGVRHVDLLRFKLHGKLSDNPYLTDNDVVFVPLRDRVIQVVGAVKRPEMYELKAEKTLADVVDLAGGFNNAVARSEPVRVIRYVEGEKIVDEVPNDSRDLDNYSIKSGDVVVVSNVVTKDTEFDYNVASIPGDQVFYPSYEDRVFVLGGVAFPGAYPFSPYYTLSQYVTLAGGISDRGSDDFKVTAIDGKTRKAKLSERVNPGDTIMVKQKIMSNAQWAGFGLSIASFGLAASSTIIAISK